MRLLPVWAYLCVSCVLAGAVFADVDAVTDTVADIGIAVPADGYADTLVTAIADTSATADTALTGVSSPAVTDTVFYEADFAEYDNVERVLVLTGRAVVRYQNITLQADTIIYTVSNDQFQARGLPQLIEGNDTTVGDFMVYNIKTRRGRVTYAMARFDDTYVTGSNIVKTADNRLYIEQGDYTTCQDPAHPHYYFYGRHIKVIPEDKVISRPVVLNIADAPVAILPYFIMPLERGKRSGWLAPSWGGSVSRGGYIDNLGYYYAPNDYYDLMLSSKVQEFNSFVFNTRGRYALRYVLDGEVSGRYVVDNRLETSTQQWALDYRHNQFLTPDGKTRLAGRGSILSSRTFNQMYSDNTYELEQQQLDANMSLSHRFTDINASTNLTWRRNHNLTTDRIVEDMPSFDFNLQNRAFLPYKPGAGTDGPAWYNNIFYSYNTKAVMRRDVSGDVLLTDSIRLVRREAEDTVVNASMLRPASFIRPGMEHNARLTSSQKLFKYLDVSPFFNMRASMFHGVIDTLIRDTTFYREIVEYQVSNLARDTRYPNYEPLDTTLTIFINGFGEFDTVYTIRKLGPVKQRHERGDTLNEFKMVSSWNTGVNLSTRIYGHFPVGGAFGGVTAVRHTMSPTVGYNYVPKHDLDKMFFNVGINYDRPRAKAQQLVNFGLANTFQGKRTVAGNRGGSDGLRPGGASMAGRAGAMNDDNGRGSGIGAIDDVDRVDDTVSVTDTVLVNRRNVVAPPREQKFDILSLSLNTAYDFEADERNWRDLSLNASTSISILNVGHTSVFWLYDENNELTSPITRSYSIDLTSRSLGVAGKFWDGDLLYLDVEDPAAPGSPKLQSWNFGFSPSYSYRASRISPQDRFLPSRSFNIRSNASMNLTNAMSVQWSGNYDFSSSSFTHNNFTFRYDLECWEMRFTWRPEKINPGFHFVINIKKIPDIKWEQRESRTTRVL